jgi:hypothetical protein
MRSCHARGASSAEQRGGDALPFAGGVSGSDEQMTYPSGFPAQRAAPPILKRAELRDRKWRFPVSHHDL